MPHRYFHIKSRQRRSKSARRIAVNEHGIGLFLFQHGFHPAERACRYIEKRLPLAHYFQVVIRICFKSGKHIIEHFPVLPRNTYLHVKYAPAFQLRYERTHFHRLRSRAEYEHYFFHKYISDIVF